MCYIKVSNQILMMHQLKKSTKLEVHEIKSSNIEIDNTAVHTSVKKAQIYLVSFEKWDLQFQKLSNFIKLSSKKICLDSTL